jgi:hypothetical protein
MSLQLKPSFPGGIAVKPDIRDIAPVYGLENEFMSKQSLSISWRVGFVVGKWIEEYLKFDLGWNRYCGATLKEKKGLKKWETIIEADRLYWNLP